MVWVRTVLGELHAWEWLGILIARLAVGLLFLLSGRGVQRGSLDLVQCSPLVTWPWRNLEYPWRARL